MRSLDPTGLDSIPISSAINNDRPILTYAMKLPACFPAASMKIVKTSCILSSVSVIVPCAILVITLSVVPTNSKKCTNESCCDNRSNYLKDKQ